MLCRAPDKVEFGGYLKIFFLFLNENLCCDPSSEGFNERSQHMVLWRNNWKIIYTL